MSFVSDYNDNWTYIGETFHRQRDNRQYTVTYTSNQILKSCINFNVPHVHICSIYIGLKATPTAHNGWSYSNKLREIRYKCKDVHQAIELFEQLKEKEFFTNYIADVLMECLL